MEFGKMDWENGDCVGKLKKVVKDVQFGKEEDLSDNDVKFCFSAKFSTGEGIRRINVGIVLVEIVGEEHTFH
jgi:hypothetical protein